MWELQVLSRETARPTGHDYCIFWPKSVYRLQLCYHYYHREIRVNISMGGCQELPQVSRSLKK